MDLPRQIVVIRDTREQAPLLFPTHVSVKWPNGETMRHQVHVVDRKLDTGDYLLDCAPTAAIIERKGSISEISGNCLTKDKVRFEACLARLRSSCKFPSLLVQGDARSLLTPTKYAPEPGHALDSFFQLLAKYQIPFYTFKTRTQDDRRLAGEFVLRALIAGAMAYGDHGTQGSTPPAS